MDRDITQFFQTDTHQFLCANIFVLCCYGNTLLCGLSCIQCDNIFMFDHMMVLVLQT